MLDPIRARLASSFCRKGIIDVATENTILGDTSIRSTLDLGNSVVSALNLPDTLFLTKCPSASIGSLACTTLYLSSSSAVRYTTSSVTTGFLGSVLSSLLYGASTKPYSLIRAYVASELISPMLGPSGVSIGHILP